MKILMPEEVEANNVITKKELQAILKALEPHGRIMASRAQLKCMETVRPKIERVLAKLGK